MLALQKAKRISDSGKVLFLCFNKFLLESLKTTSENTQYNIDFYNLPGLVCAKTDVLDAGGNEGISEYLNSVDPDSWEYSHIIIDEGQDFCEEHLEILSTLAELKHGCFYVFYDKNQLVQQRQSLNWVKTVECRLVLSANCRNTKNIAVTSNKSLGIDKVKMRLDVAGSKPNFYINCSCNQVCDNISKLIRKYTDNGIQKKGIVILTVKTEENSVLSGLSSIGSYKLASNRSENKILFTSARKFKGLESSVVILVDVDEKTFASEEERRVFYVGSSRAKHYLEIFTCMDDEELVNMATAINNGVSVKNPKATIGSKLKVKIVADA
jgi:DNA helicase IV